MDRRAVERSRAEVPVVGQVRGRNEAGLIYDISTDGCMLQASNGFCEAGDDIELTFGAFQLRGRVIWTKHRNAGVQFDGRVPDSTIAAIIAEGAPPEPTVPARVELPQAARRVHFAVYGALGLLSGLLLLAR